MDNFKHEFVRSAWWFSLRYVTPLLAAAAHGKDTVAALVLAVLWWWSVNAVQYTVDRWVGLKQTRIAAKLTSTYVDDATFADAKNYAEAMSKGLAEISQDESKLVQELENGRFDNIRMLIRIHMDGRREDFLRSINGLGSKEPRLAQVGPRIDSETAGDFEVGDEVLVDMHFGGRRVPVRAIVTSMHAPGHFPEGEDAFIGQAPPDEPNWQGSSAFRDADLIRIVRKCSETDG
jgi:hypothetical protein